MAVYAFSDGISKALPFLVFPIVAYYLTTEEFGRVTNFNVLVSILVPFIGFSNYSALSVDYYRQTPKSLPILYANLLYLNFFLFLFVSTIIFVFFRKITQWTELSSNWLVLAIFLALLGAVKNLFTVKMQLDEKANLFGIFQFTTSSIGAGLAFLFVAIFNWSWQGRIYSQFIAEFIGGTIAIIVAFKIIKVLIKPDFKQIYAFFIFGLPLLPHNLSYWLKSGFEKLLITSSLGLSANGIYSFAQTISSIFVMFSGAFFSAFAPYLYKRLAVIEDKSNKLDAITLKIDLVKKSYIFLLVFCFILIIGFIGSYFMIKFYFADKYIQAIKFLPFFLGFNFFNAVYSIFSAYIFFTKKTKFLGIITISTAFLQVLLTVMLLRIFDAIGAGIATFIVSIITAFLVIVYSNKVYPMPWLYFVKR